MCHARTKYLEVYNHFIEENVLKGEIDLKHINTKEQMTYMLTKVISASKFEEFRAQMEMIREELNKISRC